MTLPEGVLVLYDLGGIEAIDPQHGGWIGESWRVTSERGRFFFKRREEGCTPEAVTCDHALVRFLVGHGFPTPSLLPSRDGATWVTWQGRLYEAYAWVEGLGFVPGDEWQKAGLGRVVGRYHRLVAGYHPPHLKLPPWGDVSVSAFLDVSGYVASRWAVLTEAGWVGERETPFVREAVAQLQAQAARVKEEEGLVPLVVHGALGPGNVLFGPGGEAVAVVDWADSAQFVRAYDVAHAVQKFAGRRPDAVLPGHVGSSLHRRGVERFAEAYREEVRLTATERALLPWLMLAQRIVDALWVDERLPLDAFGGTWSLDHRRELELAEGLWAWLQENSAFLDAAFA